MKCLASAIVEFHWIQIWHPYPIYMWMYQSKVLIPCLLLRSQVVEIAASDDLFCSKQYLKYLCIAGVSLRWYWFRYILGKVCLAYLRYVIWNLKYIHNVLYLSIFLKMFLSRCFVFKKDFCCCAVLFSRFRFISGTKIALQGKDGCHHPSSVHGQQAFRQSCKEHGTGLSSQGTLSYRPPIRALQIHR